MNKKKRIWMFVLLVVVILIVGYMKKPISIKGAFLELDTAAIDDVLLTTYEREKPVHLDSKDTGRFIAVVDDLVMKKKLMPNLPAFTEDAYMLFRSGDSRYTIRFDYGRNIIGISKDRKRMQQFILEEDAELFSFVKKFL